MSRPRPSSMACISSLFFAGLLFVPQDGKRPLTHDDYDTWRSISDTVVSRDGRWIALSYVPRDGDAELLVRETEGTRRLTHPRGRRPRFTKDGRFCVFLVDPSKEAQLEHKWSQVRKRGKSSSSSGGRGERSQERGGRPGRGARPGQSRSGRSSDGPKKNLVFVDLKLNKKGMVKRVKSFLIPEEGPSVLVYQLEPAEKKPGKKDGKKEKSSGKKSGTRKADALQRPRRGQRRRRGGGSETGTSSAGKGSPLVLYDLAGQKNLKRWPNVTRYAIAKKRRVLYFVQKAEGEGKKGGLFAVPLDSGEARCVLSGPGEFKGFSVDKEERRIAFFSRPEPLPKKKPKKKKKEGEAGKEQAGKQQTGEQQAGEQQAGEEGKEGEKQDKEAKKKKKPYSLYLWDWESEAATKILAKGSIPGFGETYEPSSDRAVRFSKDGSVLLLGVREPEEDMPPFLPDDKVTLDLWHFKDPLLQPMQGRRAAQDRRRAVPCAWHIDSEKLVRLGDKETSQVQLITPDGTLALLHDQRPYAPLVSWDGGYYDVYQIRTVDGKRTRVLRRLRSRAQPSSTGRYLLYFDADRNWHCIDVDSGIERNLTSGLSVNWYQEDWDRPSPPRAHGVAGWAENDAYVLIYDRYDVWRFAPDGSSRTCLTDGVGRASKIVLRYVSEDPEQEAIHPKKRLLLSAFNEETMASGYFEDSLEGVTKPKKLVMAERAFGRRLIKAKDAERFVFSMSTFEVYPDLWTARGDFTDMRRLTDANPQQEKVRWGKAELVRWHSTDGIPLKGILIKPDGFDSSKKYPLMVYFYERRSRTLHNYRTPQPGTSPNASYYVSNGYLWFVPDIVYRVGYPGQSCKSCVVPGVLHLIKQGFVDEDAIGMAGHSWGGYQTAYLVTQTNLFKAAESGAPVSNMISAYGGIRWSSGMSRAFQYERTQSRIGGSLWQYPLRFVENSPIFFVDKVKTPLLILHNDQDGAVPWYQGIELFCALRRLGKEAYLFNYNGQAHGLRRRSDQKDWTRRMQEFFDHHLRGHPAPEWMTSGVPYVARDREKLPYYRKPPAAEVESSTENTQVSGEEPKAPGGAKGRGNSKTGSNKTGNSKTGGSSERRQRR